jgi:hypothetical protein
MILEASRHLQAYENMALYRLALATINLMVAYETQHAHQTLAG